MAANVERGEPGVGILARSIYLNKVILVLFSTAFYSALLDRIYVKRKNAKNNPVWFTFLPAGNRSFEKQRMVNEKSDSFNL